MQGMRLVVAMLAALLTLGCSIALGAQGESGDSVQDDGALSTPPQIDPASEVKAERTATSQTFLLPSGQLETRLYETPINFRDANGQWKPIGEGFEELGDGSLSNGPNSFDVSLPESLGDEPLRLSTDAGWVTTELLGPEPEEVQPEGATASYELADGDTSFEFSSLPNGIKEDIVIDDLSQPSTFRFELDASSGLAPTLRDDGAIVFRDEGGRAVVTLPAPVMSDSAPQPAVSHAIHYELGPEVEGHWTLAVEADRDWLAQPDRVFPARLDPTMTVGPELDCIIGGKKGQTGWIDCAAWGRKEDLLKYSPQLEAAKDEWQRGLMELETWLIPAGASVGSATFNIRSNATATNTSGVELRKVTKPWTWQASWSQYDGPTKLWSAEGGDYSTSLGEVLTAQRGNQVGWWQFTVPASAVQEAVAKSESLSMLLKLIDDKSRVCGGSSCTQRSVNFDSSAATIVANRPYLSVVYTMPAPIVTTEAATSVTETGATLKGQVNPNGYATTYQFEYGTTTSYGTKVPTTAESVGSGTTNVPVSKAISGLKGNTTYHYRVSATNANGTTPGLDKAFTTPKLPSLTTETPLYIGITDAILRGSVNPNGSSTTYQFEYGPNTAYGQKQPLSPASAGSGTTAVNFFPELKGLTEGATYHYRVVATNTAGSVAGSDKVFTTLDPPETTISSPMPTYTSGETPPPVAFKADQSGGTFKCSLDEGETPKETCSSPYSLPAHLSFGWHTFVVAATNAKGETDPIPAKYVFNTGIYPPAPSTSKLTAPTEGEKTASYYTLQAEWGEPPLQGGVTGVTFQMKQPSWDEFRPVPAECVIDGKGNQVSWPLSVSQNPGHSDPVFLKVNNCISNPGDIKFRAVFDGGVDAAGASEPVATEYVGKHDGVGAPTDAIEQVGPANLDLLTGNFTLSRTDVSIPVPGSEATLEFTRTYQSNYNDEAVSSMALGGMWQPAGPMEQEFEGEAWSELREHHEEGVAAQYDQECEEEGYSHEECLIEDAIPAADWIELFDNQGGEAAFEIQGGNYIAPEYMKEYVLTRQGEGAGTTFELASPEGTHTVFTKNAVGIQGSYRPSSVSWQATAKSARMVYEQVPGGSRYRLIKMIAPAPAGVTCTDTGATKTPGCRALVFNYLACSCAGLTRLSSISYYNSSGQESQAQPVAEYKYDPKYRLVAVWDPRISPELEEVYTYDSFYKMLSLTPPGQKPWEFKYYDWPNANWEGRLKSVSRASLLESPKTAQSTIVYEVPISGGGAPYDLSPASVAEWGQTDYPVNATAIFPPSEVPAEPPSDYSEATVSYMDPDGYVVNTVSPKVPGASGLTLSTTETDRHGNVVRSLSPRNRLLALAAGKESAIRSHQLDSQSTYSADGTEMLESLGPLHKVRLESGPTVEARARTAVEYDKGAPTPKEGEAWPHLPTTETTNALKLNGKNSNHG